MSEISERLYRQILSSGYSYGELSRLTGIPKSAIQRYATGETGKIPMDRLKLLAASLDVSAEYLMGWSQPEYPELMQLAQETAEEQRLLEGFRKLNEMNKGRVLQMVDMLLEQQ